MSDVGEEIMMTTDTTKDVDVIPRTGTGTAMIGIIVAAIMTIVMTGTMTGEGGDHDPPADGVGSLALELVPRN